MNREESDRAGGRRGRQYGAHEANRQPSSGASRGSGRRSRPGRRSGGRRRSALPLRGTLAAAARAGRRNVWQIFLVAVVVSVAASLVEIAARGLVDRASIPLSLLGDLGTSSVSLVGVVFLSGFLARLVGEAEHGRPHASPWQVMRGLPWSRLIRADVLVVVLVVLGLIALVIPGLILLNLFAVVGPVIEIEHPPVFAALRRSAHLVRSHFWGVLLLATLPMLIAEELPADVPRSTGLREILTFLAVGGVAEGLVAAALGLVLVELCYGLILADGSDDDAGDQPPGGDSLACRFSPAGRSYPAFLIAG